MYNSQDHRTDFWFYIFPILWYFTLMELTKALKTNNISNFNKFLTIRPILDLKMLSRLKTLWFCITCIIMSLQKKKLFLYRKHIFTSFVIRKFKNPPVCELYVWLFWFTFLGTYASTIFTTSRKNGPRPKRTICQKCLSVDLKKIRNRT